MTSTAYNFYFAFALAYNVFILDQRFGRGDVFFYKHAVPPELSVFASAFSFAFLSYILPPVAMNLCLCLSLLKSRHGSFAFKILPPKTLLHLHPPSRLPGMNCVVVHGFANYGRSVKTAFVRCIQRNSESAAFTG